MNAFEQGSSDRASVLQKAQSSKMARSSHAYVRGSTVKFYEWLATSSARLPQGPAIWICGDCHLGNLGPVVDLKGRVAMQIRDLDQTVIGNPAHDIVRLGLSLASAARGSDLPGATTIDMLEQLVAGYQSALAGAFNTKRDKAHRSRTIQLVLGRSMRRNWRDLSGDRTEGNERRFPIGKQFWALTSEERQAIAALFASEHARRALTKFAHRNDDAPLELLDAVYWVKGCSSLGRLRYAAIARIGSGHEADVTLVDIKEAIPAAASFSDAGQMPADYADRVVAGARALSPNLGDRMLALSLGGKPMVLRELMPQDIKLEIEHLAPREASALSFYLGGVVGRAHGRQMTLGQRQLWLAELDNKHTSSLDAPAWLWDSVVQLVGLHESAYLQHCRLHVGTSKQDMDQRPVLKTA